MKIVAAISGTAFALLILPAFLFLRPVFQPITLGEVLGTLPRTTAFLDRKGRLLHEFLDEKGLRAQAFYSLDGIPPQTLRALTAAEDHRFFEHPGFDLHAIGRAFLANLFARKIVQGGSTLSQQTASLIWPRPRTLLGKCQEIRDALRLEHSFTKNDIALLYLNLAPFGNRIQGIKRASRIYFGKDTSLLSTAEGAFLVAIPLNPTRLNPLKNNDQTFARQKRVLNRMKDLGTLSADEWQLAMAERPVIEPTTGEPKAPHFIAHLQKNYPEKLKSGLAHPTTLDLDLQREVQALVRQQLKRLEHKNAGSGACVILHNTTGEVRAWVGSPDFHSVQVDGVTILRQPGSSVKPFTYLLGLAEGENAASILPDVRLSFPARGGTYEPANYSREYHGPVRLREALANSYNLPAVFLLHQLGVEKLQLLFRKLQLGDLQEDPEHYGLGLTLGNAELRLWQLANAYRMIANDGRFSPILFFPGPTSVNQKSAVHFFEAEECQLLKDILSDDRSRETSFGRDGYLNPGFRVAAKTGTSQDFKDNFALGFSDEYTVAVWVGNPDRTAMRGVSGISGAGPIFSAVFQRLHRERPQTLTIPAEIFENRKICSLSGLAPGPHCPQVTEEIFLKNKIPSQEKNQLCDWHTAEGSALPRIYHPWLARTSEGETRQPTARRTEKLEIQSPRENDHFLFDARQDRAGKGIPVRIASSLREGKVTFILNGKSMGEAAYPYQQSFVLSPGAYTLSLRHSTGASSRSVSFVVE